MNALILEAKLDAPPGFRVDGILGTSVFQVLEDTRDLRRFRASVMEIALISATDRRRRAILILDVPKISEERLRKEWQGIQSLFHSDLLDRITLVVRHENRPLQIFGHLTEEEERSIETVTQHTRRNRSHQPRRSSEAFFDILRVLLVHWFRKSGPLSSKYLSEQTGFSYPTIAAALVRLEPYLLRHSDRQVELQTFPTEAWFLAVAQADRIRSSRRFADPSGRPRPVEVLLDRLRDLGRDDIAVAGVLGARHYVPGLDLAGTPRLDLIVHSKDSAGSPDFIRRLDPATKPVGPREPCTLVVHTLFRPDPMFGPTDHGIRWADEVECLLDLHEMRLESQAMEFIEHLTPKPTS